MIDVTLILDQLKECDRQLEDTRRKMYNFYCLASGDYRMFGQPTAKGSSIAEVQQADTRGFYQLLDIRSFPGNRINHLKPLLRQHLLQSTMSFPAATVVGVEPTTKSVLEKYVDLRVGNRVGFGCHGAKEHFRWVADHLISGIGWIVNEFYSNPGSPYRQQRLTYVGTLDTVWDLTASSVDRARFFAWRERRTASDWLKALPELTDEKKAELAQTPNRVVAFLHYFDVWGSELFFELSSPYGCSPGALVAARESWAYDELAYGKRWFLPVTALAGPHAPHVCIPTGLVEDCLSALQDVYEAEAAIRSALLATRTRIFADMTQLADDDQVIQSLLDAINGLRPDESIAYRIKTRQGGASNIPKPVEAAIHQISGIPLDSALLMRYETAVRNLNKVGGANPYAYGSAEPGVTTATEANAINVESQGLQKAISGSVFAATSSAADRMLRLVKWDQEP